MLLCSLYISNSTYVRNNLLPQYPHQLSNFLCCPCDFFYHWFIFFEAQVMPWPRADQDSSTRKRIQNETPWNPKWVCFCLYFFSHLCCLKWVCFCVSEFDNDVSFIQSGHLYCLLVSHWVGKEKVLFGNSFGHFLFSCKFHSAWKDGCCWGKGKN